MVKKINILVLLLLVLLSVGAVSASEDVNLTDNNANSDILEISENLMDASNNFYHAPYFLKDKKRDQAESLVF